MGGWMKSARLLENHSTGSFAWVRGAGIPHERRPLTGDVEPSSFLMRENRLRPRAVCGDTKAAAGGLPAGRTALSAGQF